MKKKHKEWIIILAALFTILGTVIALLSFLKKDETKEPKVLYWLVPFSSFPEVFLPDKKLTLVFSGVEIANVGNVSAEGVTVEFQTARRVHTLKCVVSGLKNNDLDCTKNPPFSLSFEHINPQQTILVTVLLDDDPGKVSAIVTMKNGEKGKQLFPILLDWIKKTGGKK